MTIEKKLNGSTLNVVLTGELNTQTAPQLEAELAPDLESIDNLVIDVTALTYLSSAGLRVLLAAQQEIQDRGDVTLSGVNEDIREILEVTGFDSILKIV